MLASLLRLCMLIVRCVLAVGNRLPATGCGCLLSVACVSCVCVDVLLVGVGCLLVGWCVLIVRWCNVLYVLAAVVCFVC